MAETTKKADVRKNDPLRCECGCRRFLRTDVLGPDGNPYTGDYDEILWCPACQRAWKLDTTGVDVTLTKAIGVSSVSAWRTV